MARLFTGRQNIICMQGAYHGRTYGAMAVTRSKTVYSQGAAPLMPGVYSIPFPFWHQQRVSPTTDAEKLAAESLYQLDYLPSNQQSSASKIEPVLGEGLCTVSSSLSPWTQKGFRQSGFGRTGKFFAIEYSGVKADILVIAKASSPVENVPYSCRCDNEESSRRANKRGYLLTSGTPFPPGITLLDCFQRQTVAEVKPDITVDNHIFDILEAKDFMAILTAQETIEVWLGDALSKWL
ncbi:Pyridoxal phosphate-dependent transferase [Amanita muscaria]